MELKKVNIINALFLLNFPFYGIGFYVARYGNFSIGTLISSLPLIIIFAFFVIDSLINKKVVVFVNSNYIILFLFMLFCIYSLFLGLNYEIPQLNSTNTIVLSLFLFIVFHSSIIVQYYNRDNNNYSIGDWLYWSLSILILINLLGYFAGFKNPNQTIEGRLNLPFGPGLYFAAHTTAVINLLIISKWLKSNFYKNFKLVDLIIFFFNLIIMFQVSSRIAILTFSLVVFLLISRLYFFHRILYLFSLLFIPFLLNFTLLLWDVISHPLFNKILQNRVSFETVTTFNGRRYIWEEGINWLLSHGKGFLLGNGYRGHYTIDLLSGLHEGWEIWETYDLHMHSTSFEYLLSIGIIGVIPFFIL